MNWRTEYNNKIVSLKEAISHIKSGDKICTGHAAGESLPLVEELVKQKDRLYNVEISHLNNIGNCAYSEEGMEEHFKLSTTFVGGAARKHVNEGRADFIPVFFSELPRLYTEKIINLDVALIQLSPPDQHGYCSFGVTVDYIEAIAKEATIVIAEINQQMPRTMGTFIHVSELDYIVETNRPLIEVNSPPVSDLDQQIGEHISKLVPDGANLQLGFGGIPNAVSNLLRNKKDLGVHTELLTESIVDLYEAGAITGKYNNLNPGKLVSTFVLGSRRLYDFVDNNPMVLMKPVDYTNNVLYAGRVNNLTSINAALQVDLFGQVNAETLGFKQFSGVGGQVDFVRSASLSKGGKSIIALRSTAKKNTISTIVPTLDKGTCITTSRYDVQYIVTEYGVAKLRGKTLTERAEALIAIAHPNFREQLREDAIKNGVIKVKKVLSTV